MQDVVYLKNGSIIRGNIHEPLANDKVFIETVSGNIFVYQMDEIEKLTKEPFYVKDKIDNTGIKKGYYGVFEFGTGFCFGYDTKSMDRNINFISGYRVNPWFAAGAGFGLRYYPEAGFMMPFFADLRANLLNKRKSPYLSLDIGYAFNPNDVMIGGFMMAPTIGVSVKAKNRIALNIGLCYEMQRSVYYEDHVAFYNYDPYSYGPIYYEEEVPITNHTVRFLFGVMF